MKTRYVRGPATPSAQNVIGINEGDYGALTTGLLDGEPVFVLRAKDATTLAVLNLYRVMTEGLFEDDRAFSLEADIQAVIDWRFQNQDKLRDPD